MPNFNIPNINADYNFEDYIYALNELISQANIPGLSDIHDLGINIADLPYDTEKENLDYIYNEVETALDNLGYPTDLEPDESDIDLSVIETPIEPEELPYEDNVFDILPQSGDIYTQNYYNISSDPEIVDKVDEVLDFTVSESGSQTDMSYYTLNYLKAFGFSQVTWLLSREWKSEEDKKDWGDDHHCMCDLNHGNTFTIADILEYGEGYAASKGFTPAAPMYALANHPGCNCFLVAEKLNNFNSYTDLLDGSPGIPFSSDKSKINAYKEQIFNNIPDTIYIKASTIPPMDYLKNYGNKVSKKVIQRSKKSQKLGSTNKVIIPVEVNNSFYYISNFGLTYKVDQGDYGFIIEESDDKCLVYLSKLGSVIRIKKNNLSVLSLVHKDVDVQNAFIEWRGRLGLTTFSINNDVYAYIPKYNKIKKVDSFKTLTF